MSRKQKLFAIIVCIAILLDRAAKYQCSESEPPYQAAHSLSIRYRHCALNLLRSFITQKPLSQERPPSVLTEESLSKKRTDLKESLHGEGHQSSKEIIYLSEKECYYLLNEEQEDDSSIIALTEEGEAIAANVGDGAKGNGVQVHLSSPLVSVANPGQTVTVSAFITNQTQQQQVVDTRFHLPKGWLAIPQEVDTLFLQPGQQQVNIVALMIPRTARAGSYTILCETISKDNPQIRDRDTIEIVVDSKAELTATIERKPALVLPGERYSIHINYHNTGNVPLSCSVRAKVYPDSEIAVSNPEFILQPQEHQVYTLSVQVDPLANFTRTSINIQAFDTEKNAVLTSTSIAVEVASDARKGHKEFDEVPSNYRIIAVGADKSRAYAQEVSGKGKLDKKRDIRMEYCFRRVAPHRHNKKVIINSLYERYFLQLKNPASQLQLGDTSYTLSPLTQQSRYARGFGVEHKPQPYGIKAFYIENIFPSIDGKQHAFGMKASYTPWEKTTFSLNLLQKQQAKKKYSEFVSAHAECNLGDISKITAEVAKDLKKDMAYAHRQAYRVTMHGKTDSSLWYSLDKGRAGGGYYGYYHNIDYFSGSVDIPILNNLRINLSANSAKNGLHPTLQNSSSSQYKRYNAALTYNIASCLSWNINGYQLRSRNASQTYNYNQRWLETSLGWNCNSLISNVGIGRGWQYNYLTQKTIRNNIHKAYFRGAMNVSPQWFCSIFGETGNANISNINSRYSQVGCSVKYNLNPSSSLQALFQKAKNWLKNDPTSTRIVRLCSGSFIYTLPNRHVISFNAQYFKHMSKTQPSSNNLFFNFTYTIPFGLPVGKNLDNGSIVGTIYDPMTNVPIPDAILNLQGIRTTTDARGMYTFSGIQPGKYYLSTEYLPDRRILSKSDYVPITVIGGQQIRVPLEAVTKASIKGKIIQMNLKRIKEAVGQPFQKYGDGIASADPARDSQDGVPFKYVESPFRHTARVLLHREDFSESFSQVCDKNGEFQFSSLRPGKWIISVVIENMPLHYSLDERSMIINVNPDEDKTVTFVLRQKVRKLILLE